VSLSSQLRSSDEQGQLIIVSNILIGKKIDNRHEQAEHRTQTSGQAVTWTCASPTGLFGMALHGELQDFSIWLRVRQAVVSRYNTRG
jgi:hypothetical protein